MATMGACRLLLVCVFCALLCSPAVTADDAATVKEGISKALEKSNKLKEALESVAKKDLTAAEGCVEKLNEVDGAQEKIDQAKDGVSCLTAAVKDAAGATDAAIKEYFELQTSGSAAVIRQPSPIEQSPEMERLRTLLDAVMQAAFGVLGEVKKISEASEKLSVIVEKNDVSQMDTVKGEVNEIKGALANAKAEVNKAIEAHGQLAEVEKKILEKLEKKPDDSGISSGSGVGGQEGSGGKEGTQSQTDAKDSATDGSQGTEGNNMPTGEPSERDTTLSGIQEDNTLDGAHGGAIATCTAAPLLLLLTAVAYAAVC